MNTSESDRGNSSPGAAEAPVLDIRHLTDDQLARLGMPRIAYVKPVIVNGVHGFAIHAADGTAMGLAEDKETAVAAILDHEMFAVWVH